MADSLPLAGTQTGIANSQTATNISPPNTNGNVDASTLNTGQTTPLTIPQSNNPNPAFVSGIDSGVATANQNYQNTLAQGDQNAGVASSNTLNQNVSNAQGTVDQTTSEINSLMNQLGYKNQDTFNAQQQYQLPQLTSQLADLNSQYASAKAAYDNQYQQTGNQNIPTGFVTGQLAIEHAAAATQLGSLAAQIQAANGNINTANQTIENTINNKYTNIQNQLDNLQKFYDINKANLTTAQQLQATRQSAILDQQKQAVANQQAFATQAQKDLQTAISGGQIDPTTGYKALSDYLNDKTSIGDFYNAIGGQSPVGSTSTGNTNGQGVVNTTMQLMGATNDMPVSQAITTLGMTPIVQGLISQEGGSPQGVVNNPGNIKFAGLPGQTDSGVKAADGGTFASYATPQAGQTAVQNLVQKAADNGQNLSDFIASYKGVSNNPMTVSASQLNNMPQVSMNSDGTVNATDQTNFLSKLPSSVATLVTGIADYSINPSSIPTRNYRGVGGLTQPQVLALASQYDPSYDSKQYSTRQAVLKNFTSGQYSQNINALNTAIGHLVDLSSNFAKLNNAGFTPYNAVANTIEKATGNGAIASAGTNINAAVGELASVFKGTGATDQEIKNMGNVDVNSSPDQVKNFIETATQLLASRLDALQQTYTSGMGKAPDKNFLSPTSIQQLSSLKQQGYDIQVPGVTDTVAMIGPDGQTYNVPSANQQAFIKAGGKLQ